ncbi:MAG: nucleoside monophosphate kinase [Enterobacterales bacterium]
MKIALLGAPGSGKGTQSRILKNLYNIKHISIGDILRKIIHNENYLSYLKKDIEKCLNTGVLVNDRIIFKIVKNCINNTDCNNGFILDGFPRNLNQAINMENIGIILDIIIYIDIPNSFILNRIKNRSINKYNNNIYNKKLILEKNLIKRQDDKINVLKQRIDEFNKNNKSLTFFLKTTFSKNKTRFFSVNGTYDIEHVTNAIIKLINNL